MDVKVQKVQMWLNAQYGSNPNFELVSTDGITGGKTVKALIKALQIEINSQITDDGEKIKVDGDYGNSSQLAFFDLFPKWLGKDTNATEEYVKNIILIIKGGFFCKGYDAGDFNPVFDDNTEKATRELDADIGWESNGKVRPGFIFALLSTDPYIITGEQTTGKKNIRKAQQYLNKNYNSCYQIVPTNGIYDNKSSEFILRAIQYKIGADVDGLWGNQTLQNLPVLQRGSSNKDMVYLLQCALYFNKYDCNGLDGQFGGGAFNAVKACQNDYALDSDGICGRQTWGALLVSCGDHSRSAVACDTRFEITADLIKRLKNDGFAIIGRYLTGGSFKELREGELERILNNGMKAFLIFQNQNRKIDTFGPIEGGRAAVAANGSAKKNGIPSGTVIYFAVDMDVYDSQIEKYIVPYFEGINKFIDKRFKVGIYGPRKVCRKIMELNLAESSFVSDMSYKFAANIGEKLPSNWCFDQFNEIRNYYNGVDIDKVTYRGNIPALSSIDKSLYSVNERNIGFYQKLERLYNLATEYCENDLSFNRTILRKNKLVLGYLRYSSYNSIWYSLAGPVESAWKDYVDANVPEDFTKEMYEKQSYIYDNKFNTAITLAHLAVTAETNIYQYNNNGNNKTSSAIRDLAGWAGDLIQFVSELENDYSDRNYTEDELYDLIGSENVSGFDLEDYIQDIDAVNLFAELANKEIYKVFQEYYDEGYKKRFTKFVQNRKESGILPEDVDNNSSAYDIMYALAYKYLSKNAEWFLSQIFTVIVDRPFTADVWKEKASKAFAKKISDEINKE